MLVLPHIILMDGKMSGRRGSLMHGKMKIIMNRDGAVNAMV